ncbi:4'-phosphopantetheinyl transferase family protein [Pseudarthrobacter oxydans]|uniref:4'-phosphopantetheinyl transferase family protein n=1 Tax=Pseudarthrobacter oxydans TaxID=1671 RepID=UPI003443154A
MASDVTLVGCTTDAQAVASAREAIEVLDDSERDRLSKLSASLVADAYLVSHVLLRQSLAEHTGRAADKLQFLRSACVSCGHPHGRPYLPGRVIEFSMSHTAGYVLIAMSRSRVGVDVEAVVSASAVADLSIALSRHELEELNELDASERSDAITRAWVRKEAYLKATGEGLNVDPGKINVGFSAAPRPVPGCSIADVGVPNVYRAAVAVLS